jgi:hypothetical protein
METFLTLTDPAEKEKWCRVNKEKGKSGWSFYTSGRMCNSTILVCDPKYISNKQRSTRSCFHTVRFDLMFDRDNDNYSFAVSFFFHFVKFENHGLGEDSWRYAAAFHVEDRLQP